MAIGEMRRIREKEEVIGHLEKKRIKYVTSDDREFLDKSEAEVHEGYLRWQQEIDRKNIPCINNAYYCKTKEEFDIVIIMLSYKHGAYNWREKRCTPFNHYKDSKFFGADWYFFEHETNRDYPDSYHIETLTQRKKEYEEWLRPYEEAINEG